MNITGPNLATLERDLELLEAEGARGYDAPACDCVRSLLVRAEALPKGARPRLLLRAACHLERLTTRYRRARERAQSRLDQLEAVGAASQGRLKQALEQGDFTRIHRTSRRLARSPRCLSSRPRRAGQASIAPAEDRRRSARRYEGSLSELVASLALAHSADLVPDEAGPYNPRLIAHRALDTMRRVSPLYLRLQLERLSELAELQRLPAPEPPKPPPKPNVRRSPRRRKKAG